MCLLDRLLKTLVRDIFKDSMDSLFEHLASGKAGKVRKVCSFLFKFFSMADMRSGY